MSQEETYYPVSIKGELTEPPARGWWLIKWLLTIPHYVVLVFLWVAFVVVSIIAFFAILFTAKYPKRLFDFNVGVMRWTWRVGFYSYQALGTDKYPPFALKAGGYPADLEVAYPGNLSRGLVLVKCWLLVIPHYIVVSFFQGGWGHRYGGLVLVSAIFAGVALLFTGKYPKDIFQPCARHEPVDIPSLGLRGADDGSIPTLPPLGLAPLSGYELSKGGRKWAILLFPLQPLASFSAPSSPCYCGALSLLGLG